MATQDETRILKRVLTNEELKQICALLNVEMAHVSGFDINIDYRGVVTVHIKSFPSSDALDKAMEFVTNGNR